MSWCASKEFQLTVSEKDAGDFATKTPKKHYSLKQNNNAFVVWMSRAGAYCY